MLFQITLKPFFEEKKALPLKKNMFSSVSVSTVLASCKMKPVFGILFSLCFMLRADGLIQLFNKPWRCKYVSEQQHLVKLPGKLCNLSIPQWEIVVWFNLTGSSQRCEAWFIKLGDDDFILFLNCTVVLMRTLSCQRREERVRELCKIWAKAVLGTVIHFSPRLDTDVLTRPCQTVGVSL